MSKVNLYIDYLSQPSRAVLAFCLVNEIPHEVKETRIFTGAHRTQEFSKISPAKTVPAIEHEGFVLYESHAIMAYLANAFGKTEWYPRDPKERGLVDCYLNWHHLNVRFGCGGYLYRKFVKPKLTGRTIPKETEKEVLLNQRKSLLFLENILESHSYVARTEHPSIADLSCYAELVQLRMIQFDFNRYPNISSWMQRIESYEGVKKAHRVFNKLLPKIKL